MEKNLKLNILLSISLIYIVGIYIYQVEISTKIFHLKNYISWILPAILVNLLAFLWKDKTEKNDEKIEKYLTSKTNEAFEKTNLKTTNKETLNKNKKKSLWNYFCLCVEEKYWDFSERASRKEFLGFWLYSWLFIIIFNGINLYLTNKGYTILSIILGILFYLYLKIPEIAIYIRRGHDILGSEIFETLILVLQLLRPYYFIKIAIFKETLPTFCGLTVFLDFCTFIILCCSNGDKKNKYGEETK